MGNELPETVSHPVGAVSARRRFIFRSAPFVVPITLLLLGVAYALLPPLRGLDEPVARLASATRWLAVAMLPYVAVCATIATARFFEGSHDPTKGNESARLQIHCRVMQNTLEQFVWFGVCLLALAPLLSSSEARLIPIASVAFVCARLLYWWGYLQSGTLGRAPAVQMTFTLNGALLLLVFLLFLRSLG
jgi:uncharacterized MAPEG superfamily protein